jgi:predicted nucleotidyltransferase component of viral defense system
MNRDYYAQQVQLLVRVLPLIDTEKCFALKGGTAINLYRPLPRLSVDIDLLYLPLEEREQALPAIRAALTRISNLITKTIVGAQVKNAHEQSDALRLIVLYSGVRIKIELSPVIRGTVFSEKRMAVCDLVQEKFGYAQLQVASLPDVYAGKICAALDRQHPRDLFDVKFLLENEGFTESLRKTFLIFLISHQRPMVELLAPHRKDIRGVYRSEFVQMAQVDVPVEELENIRETLIETIRTSLTGAEKSFLLSFKSRLPEWNLLGMDNPEAIQNLPSVRWKLRNLEQMPERKHRDSLQKLSRVLGIL